MAIPSTQRAAVKSGVGTKSTTTVREIPVPQPGPGQILVKINWSGLCGTDKSLLKDEWASQGRLMKPGSHGIGGHEGSGTIAAMAKDVEKLGTWKIGDRVGVKWISSTCGECEFCTNGMDEVHCPQQRNSGSSVAGTFQEYCISDARYATRIPDSVKDEEAGPIMCGGVTAYCACKRSNVGPGQWIVVLGAGGGLGHLALQYAKAMGMRTIAVDSGPGKEELCKRLGAENFIDFTTTKDIAGEVKKITTYGAHGVLVFPASRSAYELAPMLLRPRGTSVAVGLPSDPAVVAGGNPFLIAGKRLQMVGSMVGSLKEVEEALEFTEKGLVHPVLTTGTLDDIDDLIAKMSKGELIGRAVVQVSA